MKTSHRQILRATSLLGGAGLANILISLVRNKVVAVLLGPSGLGLVGLMLSLVQTAAALGGLGISNAAVREVAIKRSSGSEDELGVVRSAISLGTLLAAAASALLLFLLRHPIAEHVLDRPDLAEVVGWMAPAVALSIITAAQTALLTGYGRVSAVAGSGVLGAALSTAAGIVILLAWGERAILPYVLAVPVGAAVAVHLLARRIPQVAWSGFRTALRQSRWLVSIGAPMMLGTFVALTSQFVVRAVINAEADLHQLGLFQAALALSTTYVGVLLQSISSDFYPRLSAVIDDRDTAIRLINEQTETLLMLAGILVLGLLALAPVALHLLYAEAFTEASGALRWLVLGNLIQIASWPLGFCLLAAARSRLYLLLEVAGAITTVTLARLLVPVVGMEGAAIATVVSAAVYLVLVSFTARRIGRSAWRRKTLLLFWTLLLASCSVFAASTYGMAPGLAIGGLLTLLWTGWVYRELRSVLFVKAVPPAVG
nr:oligosaccharide flippase family protein [uncultured Sphingomonas sp.]